MTSRPPLGVQQRQSQRSLSGPGLTQRPPAQHRPFSQQHLPQIQQSQSQIHQQQQPCRRLPLSQLPPSPVCDNGSGRSDAAELTSEGSYGLPGQFRRVPGGSRLKLELHQDQPGLLMNMDLSESPSYLESSKPFTPSRLMADTSDLAGLSPHGSTQTPTADREPAPIPLPRRRPLFAAPMTTTGDPAPTPAATTKKDTRPKPFTVEVPPAAPRYSLHPRQGSLGSASKVGSQGAGSSFNSSAAGSSTATTGYADFYPWTGNHPEDQFSDQVIRLGYFDKPPPMNAPHNETVSAKNALYQTLKHKSGVNALSTVFTSVLGHRRYTRQVTAPSTFKPPPRVTVTDTKREIWLKDLANRAVPLRRLSRTIPHGIKGKILLDQCMNKRVPIDRAIWLAKCVGANEIRSFKRKGVNGTFVMGGEAKWMRDWTLCVEQFVESVFSAFADPRWKNKVNYAIRLASHIYSEQLLDQDHYLDWILESTEKSPYSMLPTWIIIVQIYWKDLILSRNTARRLVAVLLSHLHEIQNNNDYDILAPLSSRLMSLLSKLLTFSPASFISPTTWFKCREALRTGLPQDDDECHRLYRIVDTRNERLVASCNKTPPAARQALVRLLDMTLQTPMSDDLPSKCWDLSPDKATLVHIILDWCTSIYRPGVAKVYVSRRVLTNWSTKGVDVTALFLDYIAHDPLEPAERRTALYHLACELTRSGHLSVPRYIQWLIARGGIVSQKDVEPDSRCCTRLLVELPVHALSASERTHRAGILRRASYSIDQERADHEMAVAYMKQTLGMAVNSTDLPLPSRNPPSLKKLARRIRMSSYALKADIGSWLHASLVGGMEAGSATKDSTPALEMSQTVFDSIRTILESATDLSTLASVLKPISRVSDCEILASCADTASRHVLTFAALDVAKDLFDTFYGRLRVMATEQGRGARPLLASLACLATRMPGMQAMAAQLQKDLAQTDRNNPVDACSPVSDNMGVLDDAANLHEEIEKHLANGTVLERQTMNNFFQLAMKLLNSSWNQTFERQRAYALLLARIRGFDAQHFDSLMMSWTCYVRSITNRVSIRQMFPLLLSVGCLSIPLLLASTQVDQPVTSGAGVPRPSVSGPGARNAPHVIQITWRSRYTQEVLDLVMKPHTPTGLLSEDECYRLAILQDQALRENASEIKALVRQALIEYSFCRSQGDIEGLPLDHAESRTSLVTMLRSLTLRDVNGVIQALSIKGADAHLGRLIDGIATELLIPDNDPGTQVTFDQVFELTNDFTLPFCQLKLALSLSLADQNNAGTADRIQSHLELFAKAMDNAIDAKNISWTGMLSSLSPEITHQLKSRAQTRFLDMLPSLDKHRLLDKVPEHDVQMANNLLTVMDAIIRGGSMGRPPQLIGAMADKLVDLWEVLCAQSAEPASKTAVLQHWLPPLLSFITLHTSTFDSSREGFAIRARTVLILAGILQTIASLPPTIDLVLHPYIPCVQTRLFDLACLLADSLSDEVRLQCIRLVPSSAFTTQLKYILSHPRSSSTENLMLCLREKPPPPPTTARAAQGFPAAALLGTPLSLWGGGVAAGGAGTGEKLTPFVVRRWEMLNEPTPTVGENDTAIALGMFEARKA